MKTYLRKLNIVASIILSLIILLPLNSMAEEPTEGTITISVVDEDGEGVSGNWYLYHGTTASGMLVRNGSFGEKFKMDAGYYYLDVKGLAKGHPYSHLYSKNPQFLDGGYSITFNVQYFETEEQKLAALGQEPDVQTLDMAGTTQQFDDVFDEHGCNSTQGYAWCAKSENCVRFWSPECRVMDDEEDTPAVSEAVAETAATEQPEESVVSTVPAMAEESESSSVNVPTFETPPASATPQNLNVAIEADNDMRLAQTGSSAGLLLIISSMLAAGIVYMSCRYLRS